jgi:hypothetical protein
MRRLLCGVLVVTASMVFVPSALGSFGLQRFSEAATKQNGTLDVQAGSHPYALTTTFSLTKPEVFENTLIAQGNPKDVRVELPPGFVGDPNATPKCSYSEFSKTGVCPTDTAVGVAITWFDAGEEIQYVDDPVYNLEPSPGVAAEFGFKGANIEPVFLDASVRTGGDYGITVNTRNITQSVAVYAAKVTIWGVPAEASHNALRGTCLRVVDEVAEQEIGLGVGEDEQEGPAVSAGECPVNVPVLPLLTNPTSCGVPRTATLSVDSWQEPGNFVSDTATLPELSGCERLDFSPSIEAQPDGTAGSTPTGLSVHLHVPQESTVNPAGLAEADVKDTRVTLPAGVQLSPSAADGLLACSQAQIGLENANKPTCPEASKVATVKIKTPLLPDPLEGEVYLAAPQNFAGPLENPFGSLIALYLVAEDPTAGVLVKLAGQTTPDPVTGQLVTTFENTPQLPFSDLELHFFGTARAPLSTPALCGGYTTETSIAPWSGTPAVRPSSTFQIASGPGGSPCANPLPFAPSLASGMTNINAGGFSDLTTTLSRDDGQQSIGSVQLHYPPGLSGLLSGVKLCGEGEANAGTCGAESEIGETTVSVGLGGDPFTVTGGKVFITGPYQGAPFGLSIVNPAKAGPFTLQEGRPVVVRAKVEVDPTTAALTITTDASGAHAIPRIIEGIPLQIKHVNVLVNRPGFTFNPTNCNPQSITGTIGSVEGASSPVSVPFQVTNCATLKFAPKFSVSTNAKTSKAAGASLTAKVSEPPGAMGTQADISKVKVELPLQLPSQLKTLQKACLDKVFNANPAMCPPESIVGHAIVHTQLLPVPLTGPAYFVSHGGEEFPSLTMVLQGYGVKIELVGSTLIRKGITSTTFKTVPDVPFETFELTLPQGKYAALAASLPASAKGSVCGQKLIMPSEFIAQNGMELHQNTPITVTGCPNSISVISSHVNKRTLTVSVYVPAAGKLTASGKGLSSSSKSSAGQEILTLTLKQKKAGRQKTKIKLTFAPKHGKRQTKAFKASFRR